MCALKCGKFVHGRERNLAVLNVKLFSFFFFFAIAGEVSGISCSSAERGGCSFGNEEKTLM